jgi:hypothetical protein
MKLKTDKQDGVPSSVKPTERNLIKHQTGRQGLNLVALLLMNEVIFLKENEYIRPRNINLAFRVSQEERDKIEHKMKIAGMKNLRAFIVKQALEGRIIHVELDSVREMVRLLSNATNNINQIARRVNQTGNVYAADISDIKERYDMLWAQTKEILRRLSAL